MCLPLSWATGWAVAGLSHESVGRRAKKFCECAYLVSSIATWKFKVSKRSIMCLPSSAWYHRGRRMILPKLECSGCRMDVLQIGRSRIRVLIEPIGGKKIGLDTGTSAECCLQIMTMWDSRKVLRRGRETGVTHSCSIHVHQHRKLVHRRNPFFRKRVGF